MEKQGGSSTSGESARKVFMIGAGMTEKEAGISIRAQSNPIAYSGGMPPPRFWHDEADVPGAKEMYDQIQETFNHGTPKPFTVTELNKQIDDMWRKPLPLFPKQNSKNTKRRERLNTAAGLQAKKRSFWRSLKRECKKLGWSAPSAELAESLWVSFQRPNGFRISYLKRLSQPSDCGDLTFGFAADVAIEPGKQGPDWMIHGSLKNFRSHIPLNGFTI